MPTEYAPSWLDQGRVPCLDGIRAVAVGLVILRHLNSIPGFPRLPVLGSIAGRGDIGVDIFYVISGFLITLLLRREFRRYDRVSLTAFWYRRVLRIVPAYAAYLAIVFVMTRTGMAKATTGDWLAATTYTTNCLGKGLTSCWELNHTWSLAVEEHFYLVWPVLFSVLSHRLAVRLLLVLLVVAPLTRYWLWHSGTYFSPRFFTAACMDSLAVGCLMAMVIEEKWLSRTVSAVGRRGGLVVACILALLALSHRQVNLGETFYGVVAWRLVEALLIGGAILLIVMHPATGLARFLESRPLVFAGTLSYSLYLFQQPFTNDESGTWWCRWPINMALIPLAALLSYFCIERPFLLLKRPRSFGKSRATGR